MSSMYIRTKNGVYEALSEYEPSEYTKIVYGSKVISQSENIEELCDRFVVIDKETKEVISIVSFLAYAKLWSYCKYNIYGAIWTDFGLKYVARLTEDGGVELICT